MYPVRHTVSATTDASGDATVYSEQIRGQIVQIRYAKTDFADGVDFTITNDTTGETLWAESNVNASVTRATAQPSYSTAGAAALYAAAGTAVNTPIFLCGDRVKIVVAQGGDTKTGTFQITIV